MAQFLTLSDLLYILPQGWLIILSHLSEWKIEILVKFLVCVFVKIDVLMISRVTITSCVVQPQIVSRIHQSNAKRLFPSRDYAHTTIQYPMLINDHFLPACSSRIGFTPFSSYAKACVDIAILCCIHVFLKRISKFIFNKSTKRLDPKWFWFRMLLFLGVFNLSLTGVST